MTFNVYYTDRAELDSTFVNRAWYDGTRNRLALDLNGVVYEYYDVQPATYHDLVNAPSAGTFYRKNIQGARHGQRLGEGWDVNEVQRDAVFVPDYSAVKVQDKTAPVQLSAQDGSWSVQSDGQAQFLNIARVPLAGYSVDKKADAPVTFDYTIHFVILTQDNVESKERSHSLKASSLDEALEEMFALADLLDQDIVLKGASVRFD
jgi:hypothetical protein